MVLEKSDYLDHSFLLTVLEKFSFGTNFIHQEFFAINGDVTTQYFKLKKGAQQGDQVSADLFI